MTHQKARTFLRRHNHRAARYVLVGITSFLLDAGCIWVTYKLLHLPIAAATTLGFIFGLAFNFTASKMFTFEVSSGAQGQAIRYTALLGVNYLLTLIIVSASETWGPGYMAGKLCSVGLIGSSNYLILHHWVFVTPAPGQAISPRRLAKDNMQDIREDWDVEHRKEQGDD